MSETTTYKTETAMTWKWKQETMIMITMGIDNMVHKYKEY